MTRREFIGTALGLALAPHCVGREEVEVRLDVEWLRAISKRDVGPVLYEVKYRFNLGVWKIRRDCEAIVEKFCTRFPIEGDIELVSSAWFTKDLPDDHAGRTLYLFPYSFTARI